MITEFHMKMLHGGEEAAREIYHYCGDEMLTKLYFSEMQMHLRSREGKNACKYPRTLHVPWSIG